VQRRSGPILDSKRLIFKSGVGDKALLNLGQKMALVHRNKGDLTNRNRSLKKRQTSVGKNDTLSFKSEKAR